MTQNCWLATSLWTVTAITLFQLQNCMVNSSAMVKSSITNETLDSNRSPSFQQNHGIPRRLPSPWRHGKFPVLPPRLRNRQRTSSPSTAIAGTSAPATTTEVPTTTTTTMETPFNRRMDIFDSSSSENNHLSVVWPVRRRSSASKRFRAPTPTTESPPLLLKLRQPKPTRPAIYSLDGFVPKPSVQKFVTTEPPYHFRKTDLQFLASVPRRRKINRFSKEEDEDYQTDNEAQTRRSKPVSRYTAFARKGIPGVDYPVFTYIPQTEFDCGANAGPGLYADPYTDCQVWHMCPGGNLAPRHSFLCPNGTIFNQKKRICDWWYNVDCSMHFRRTRSAVLLFPLDAMDNTPNSEPEEW